MSRTVWIENEPEPSLEELQIMIGGWIEKIQVDEDTQIIVDEEGLLKKKPQNPTVSLLAGQSLVGNAVILIGESQLK